MIVLSTVVLFATGVALLALGQTSGTVVGLHKASFVVWFGATGVHVLADATKVPGFLRTRVRGTTLRLSLVATTVAAGTCSRPQHCRRPTDCRIAHPPRSVSTRVSLTSLVLRPLDPTTRRVDPR